MFKISFKELRDNDFLSAMAKLTQCSEYKDVKVSYNIMRLGKALESKLKDTQKEWVALGDTLIQRDAKGNFASKDGDFLWKDGVDVVEAHKKVEEFLNKEVVVERFKLKLDDIAPAKLTPSQLGAIEQLVAEPGISAVN